MPKRQVRTSADAPNPAADPVAALIAKATLGTAKGLPSPEALSDLARICEYNDSQPAPTKKVSTEVAIDLLQKQHGWRGTSRTSLDTLCRRALGRKSWGTK